MDRIRTGHAVERAEYSSAESRWTVHVRRADTGETQTFTCAFLFCCGGYYRYDSGYTPEFPGVERFSGPVVHPQHWPEDLDCAGQARGGDRQRRHRRDASSRRWPRRPRT